MWPARRVSKRHRQIVVTKKRSKIATEFFVLSFGKAPLQMVPWSLFRSLRQQSVGRAVDEG